MNVLLSTYDFSNDNCYPKLKEYLKPNMRVVIIPFSHDSSYYKKERLFNSLYDYEKGKDYNIICKEFYQFGIEKQNVYVLNPFRDTIEYMKYRIDKADVVFFTGGNPVSFMRLIKKFKLLENLMNFKGITIGASARCNDTNGRIYDLLSAFGALSLQIPQRSRLRKRNRRSSSLGK